MCSRGRKCICKRKHSYAKQVSKTTKFKHQANYNRKRLPHGVPEPLPKCSARIYSRRQSGSVNQRRGRPRSKSASCSNKTAENNPTTAEKCIQVEETENKSFGVWASELVLYYLQRLTDVYSSANTRKKRLISCCSCHSFKGFKNVPAKPSFERLRLCVNECQPECNCKAQEVVMMALDFGEEQGIVQKMEGEQAVYKLKRRVSFCLPSDEDIRDADELDGDIRRKRRRMPEELGLDESQETTDDYWKVRQHVRSNSSLYPYWDRRDTAFLQSEKEQLPSIMKQPSPSPQPELKTSEQEVSYIK